MAGVLYVVATPIGNLEDITLRAVRVLGEVAAIACEDTRQTVKILNRFGFKKPLISYFHPREGQRIPEIIGLLKAGRDVALVSDAGTPGISDPGFPLIREALKEGVRVVPIPGPAAVTAALVRGGPAHAPLSLSRLPAPEGDGPAQAPRGPGRAGGDPGLLPADTPAGRVPGRGHRDPRRQARRRGQGADQDP